MKQNIRLLSFFLLLEITNSSCRKTCKCEDNYKTIPESTKEWINFGIGSIWVYRLAEDTTVFDTLTLGGIDDRSSNKFCRSEFAPAVGCSEILTMYFKHSNAKFFPRYNLDTINGDFENWHVYSHHGGGEFFQINRFGNEGVFLAFPLIKGEYYGRYTLVDTLPQFAVLNKNYTNVILSAEVDNTGIQIAAMVWYAKHIGLLRIKSVLPNNRTWELINHNIKK